VTFFADSLHPVFSDRYCYLHHPAPARAGFSISKAICRRQPFLLDRPGRITARKGLTSGPCSSRGIASATPFSSDAYCWTQTRTKQTVGTRRDLGRDVRSSRELRNVLLRSSPPTGSSDRQGGDKEACSDSEGSPDHRPARTFGRTLRWIGHLAALSVIHGKHNANDERDGCARPQNTTPRHCRILGCHSWRPCLPGRASRLL
jgi:hypothetical protein